MLVLKNCLLTKWKVFKLNDVLTFILDGDESIRDIACTYGVSPDCVTKKCIYKLLPLVFQDLNRYE